ncbi:discoidin domain-containing protein [Goodfellowiella coeruleoviolacea]|uniref:Beta-glucanase, GH16 family n=1 Tax=Goodfellowiella coeruleoviolacea TaxID=334858 RepID=A0AAE3GAJ7_9PSEU|nr:discoidin domain-containing protein [Goodfellowiella coeruleoviolacea]MCP2163454.1 Beta-glucanase, GH16 family [Goodfellowiella coeruleoviolacea]
MTTAPPQPRRWRRRRLSPLLAITGLLVGLVSAIGPPGQAVAAGTLLSQHRPVTASSTESAAFPAAAAVDGDAGTRWSSQFSDAQWLQVDLGGTASLDEVRLTWEAAYATAFTVQVSADGSAWTTVHTTTSGTGGSQVLPISGSGRYVRLNLTRRATQYGYSLWEFQVYGTAGGTPGPDRLLSYGKPGTASSSQDDANCGGCAPAKAFDLDPATRWATSSTTGWVDPGWIAVDLGATATISRVVLQWDPAYATAYQIQVSDNNTDWRGIYSTTSGRGFKETLTVSGTGRYVRMYGTQRSNGYGYSLWEFQVYGTGGNPVTPPAQPPAPHFPGTLVWGDEFTGPSGATPDPSKWTPEIGPGVNNELQYYTNNRNATLDGNGNLVIQARREVTPGSSCPVDPVSGSTTCQYTSGRLNTHGRFDFTYGRVEARIKVSSTPGLWPAFWLLGSNFFDTRTPWPNCGEIDIMEHVGKEPTRTYSTLHAPAYFGGGGYGQPLEFGVHVNAGFHVFAVEWDASHLAFSVDGNGFFTVNRDQLETTRGPWVYDHPFFIILNNAVGGDWPGPPGAGTVLPQDMVVDYVRVYQ